jgi:hypothetical protein
MRPLASRRSEIEVSLRPLFDTPWHRPHAWLSAASVLAAVALGACGETSNSHDPTGSTSGTGGTGGSGAGSGGTSGTTNGSGGSGETTGTSCPGTDAAIPAKDPLLAPAAAAAACRERGMPIDVLNRDVAQAELVGTWLCCADSPAPLEPEWSPKPCELFGNAHDGIEFTSDGKWGLLALESNQLRPVAGSTGQWLVGGGTPEHGGLTCPLFLRIEGADSSEEMRFRFTRSPTKLWLSSQNSVGGPHYAATSNQ